MELFQVSSIHLPFGSFWDVCVCVNASSGVMFNICSPKSSMPYSTKSWQHVSLCSTNSTLFHFQRINLQHLCTTHAIIYTNMAFQRRYGVEKCRANQALPSCMRSPGDWAKPPDVANTWCKNHAVQQGHDLPSHQLSVPNVKPCFDLHVISTFLQTRNEHMTQYHLTTSNSYINYHLTTTQKKKRKSEICHLSSLFSHNFPPTHLGHHEAHHAL